MTTNNSVNSPLSGTTGTGNFVGANTPTLITPVLGAATATSVNFGGSTLSTYASSQTFTPTATFGTPGNLSTGYTNQVGYYSIVGNVCTVTIFLRWTPTYTTASGNLEIGGLPFTVSNTIGQPQIGSIFFNDPTYPAGCTQLNTYAVPNTTFFSIIGSGAATSGYMTTVQCLTTVNQYFYTTFTYLV